MGKIGLHTARFLGDKETITEYDADKIIHIKSRHGDDEKPLAWFWVEGLSGRQHCSESAKEVKRMVEEYKSPPRESQVIQKIEQKGINFVWGRMNNFGGGFIFGIMTGYVANWLFSLS